MFTVVTNVLRYSQFFIRKLERRFDLYFYQGIPRYVSSVELDVKFTIGKLLVFEFDFAAALDHLFSYICCQWPSVEGAGTGFPI